MGYLGRTELLCVDRISFRLICMVLCVGYLCGTELCVWIEYHLGVGGVFLYGALCGIFGWGGSFCMVLCVGYLGGTELCVWIEYHLGVGGGVFLYGALCGIFG